MNTVELRWITHAIEIGIVDMSLLDDTSNLGLDIRMLPTIRVSHGKSATRIHRDLLELIVAVELVKIVTAIALNLLPQVLDDLAGHTSPKYPPVKSETSYEKTQSRRSHCQRGPTSVAIANYHAHQTRPRCRSGSRPSRALGLAFGILHPYIRRGCWVKVLYKNFMSAT